jgi:hypothetical protein
MEDFVKMRFIIPVAVILFSCAAFGKTASDCKHRILLLPQTHPTVLSGSLRVEPENFVKTALSQFLIAKYLEQHKDLPVFSEQVSSDKTLQNVSPNFRKVAVQIKSMFPNGLPANFEGLTDDQKNVISRAGGDAISFILRNTDMLHRVVENDQIEDQLIGKVSDWAQKNPYATTPPPEIVNTIFNVRENMALDQINNYFKSNSKQRDVVLIYGSDHYYSFLSHPDKFSAQCILVPFEFQPAITSPYGSGQGGYNTYPGSNNGQPSETIR